MGNPWTTWGAMDRERGGQMGKRSQKEGGGLRQRGREREGES